MKRIIIISAAILAAIMTIYFISAGQQVTADPEVVIIDPSTMGEAFGIEDPRFIPIYADTIYDLAENGESFIIFIGRPTCPYCVKMAPVLNDIAIDLDFEKLYYVDSSDSINDTFLNVEGISAVPTTIFFLNGEIVDFVTGFTEDPGLEAYFAAIKDA